MGNLLGAAQEKRLIWICLIVGGIALYGYDWAIIQWASKTLFWFVTPVRILAVLMWYLAWQLKKSWN